MPVPKPHKGEKQNDYMQRCMHEVSKNKDRSNDQNVAICMATWRKGPDKDQKSELTENEIIRMDVPFKNLASAREEYTKLCLELNATKERLGAFEELEIQNSDLKTQLETALASISESNLALAGRDEALGVRDQLISEKDGQLKVLKAEYDVLALKCSDLEKNQKSVNARAREIMAANSGPPAPVDNSEMEMTQDDLVRKMRDANGAELNKLYRQYKKQQENK